MDLAPLAGLPALDPRATLESNVDHASGLRLSTRVEKLPIAA